MDFNKDRFISFGRYDLIINKAFYRTMALVTIFCSTGLAIIGFFLRWIMYKAETNSYYFPEFFKLDNVTITALFIVMFISIMHIVFAGCTFHNLRNKQGRTTELTLPATNLEKFTWHVALVTLGGTLIIIAGVVCADIANAILNLAFHPMDAQSSITYGIIQIMTGQLNTVLAPSSHDLMENGVRTSIMFMAFALSLSGFTFFILGNAIKYKYNIILTYITYEFSITAIVFVIIFIAIKIADGADDVHLTDDQIFAAAKAIANVVAIFNIILSGIYVWLSYKLYKKAQITAGWNK